MPKAYWVGAHMIVKDPEKLNAYAKLAAQASASMVELFLPVVE